MEIIQTASVRYQKRDQIGAAEGKNSQVFAAYDHHLGRLLVVKEVPKADFIAPAQYFEEAKALHASEHPRVVSVFWAAETEEHICLAMPRLEQSLAARIEDLPLRPSEFLRIAQDACAGVARVHAAKLLHLDLKPTNLLLDRDGRAAVTDFGQALRLDENGTADASGHRLYIPFLPPEAIYPGVVTVAGDVYQLGLMFYRAVNGERDFKNQLAGLDRLALEALIAAGKFPNRQFSPSVPLGVRRAILRALSVNPAERQEGAAELAEDLSRFDITHDWQPLVDDDGERVWRLDRAGAASVRVRRLGELPDARVEIHTLGPSGERKKAPGEWSTGIKTPLALAKALRQAFRAAVD